MFKNEPGERLTRWREFRKTLNSLPFEKAVERVGEFWATCPYCPYYLDADLPDTWPNPWTLIEENWYCDLAKALGILYTIKFTTHDPEVEIRVYVDPETKYTYNLVWVEQGKYILNMINGQVVNKEHLTKTLELKARYQEELKLDVY